MTVQREPRIQLLRRWASRIKHTLWPRKPEEAWLRQKLAIDRRFDAQFAVDTGGVTPLSVLRIDSEHRALGCDHIACDPDELSRALDSLPEIERLTFVDMGAGKGRALLVASSRPFGRIIGVEFAPGLLQIAHDNLQRSRCATAARCQRIDLVCADAASYDLPPEDLVIYLYNPFGAEVMRKVATRTLASIRAQPRRVYILYLNPLYAEAWTENGFKAVAGGDNFILFEPPAHAEPPKETRSSSLHSTRIDRDAEGVTLG